MSREWNPVICDPHQAEENTVNFSNLTSKLFFKELETHRFKSPLFKATIRHNIRVGKTLKDVALIPPSNFENFRELLSNDSQIIVPTLTSKFDPQPQTYCPHSHLEIREFSRILSRILENSQFLFFSPYPLSMHILDTIFFRKFFNTL